MSCFRHHDGETAVGGEIQVVRVIDRDRFTERAGPGVDRGQRVAGVAVDPQGLQVVRRHHVLRTGRHRQPSGAPVRSSDRSPTPCCRCGWARRRAPGRRRRPARTRSAGRRRRCRPVRAPAAFPAAARPDSGGAGRQLHRRVMAMSDDGVSMPGIGGIFSGLDAGSGCRTPGDRQAEASAAIAAWSTRARVMPRPVRSSSRPAGREHGARRGSARSRRSSLRGRSAC